MIRVLVDRIHFNPKVEYMDYLMIKNQLKAKGYKMTETSVDIVAEREYAFPTNVEAMKVELGGKNGESER